MSVYLSFFPRVLTRLVFTIVGGTSNRYFGSFAMMNMHTLAIIRLGISSPSLSNTKKEGCDERVEDEEGCPHRLTGLPGCAKITKHATTPAMWIVDGIHELIPGEVQERHLTLGPAVVVALELPTHRGNQRRADTCSTWLLTSENRTIRSGRPGTRGLIQPQRRPLTER